MLSQKNTTTIATSSSIIRMLARCVLLVGIATSSTLLSFAADMSLSPTENSYTVDSAFTVNVYVTNNTESINGVGGTLTFPQDMVSVRSISKDGSIVKSWTEEPSYSNTNGTVNFDGALSNSGFSDTRGKVLSVTFVAKSEGVAKLALSSGHVLANDGQASNVLGKLGTASYVLTPRTTEEGAGYSTNDVLNLNSLTSDTHPDQDTWYNSRNVSFSWGPLSDVTAVRTLYDTKPLSSPTKIYDPPIRNKNFIADQDGILYMHLQMKDTKGWRESTHYRFQIDTKAPEKIIASFPEGDVTTNAAPTIKVEAWDSLSGIDHISFRVDGGDEMSYPFVPSNTYKLPKLQPGAHVITILAYDKALNSARLDTALMIDELEAPFITSYTKQSKDGDLIEITGKTYPNMGIEISFLDKGVEVRLGVTRSESDGNFTYLLSDLKPGIYEIKARSVDQNGATSYWTEERLMIVENSTPVRIGEFITKWLSLVLVTILALMLIIATFWYSLLQFKRFRRKVHRTLKEVESTLKTNVQALRRDTEEFHTILLKAEKKRDLTKEEQTILRKFNKRLDITEKEIEKKLEQMG